VSSTFAETTTTAAEDLRRSFSAAWGAIGAAWGVAPSTAAVQGYLLVSEGPLSEPEVRRALKMSHRAASLALRECEEWGLIERAPTSRRSGQRGPAAVAWTVVDDHWEWFRRVASARKERETDPVLPVIVRCTEQARTEARLHANPELARLSDRFATLLDFVRRFDRGVETFVRGDARSIENVFDALDRLEPETVDRLWRLVGELSSDDLVRAVESLAKLPAPAARRLIALADQPVLQRLIGLR
jgi:DNA-binding transcriptional regulator GbsR (MarR family)